MLQSHRIVENSPLDLIARIIGTLERVSGEREESDGKWLRD